MAIASDTIKAVTFTVPHLQIVIGATSIVASNFAEAVVGTKWVAASYIDFKMPLLFRAELQ
jgi:hypothetical protein